jgi:hypothetical protein
MGYPPPTAIGTASHAGVDVIGDVFLTLFFIIHE